MAKFSGPDLMQTAPQPVFEQPRHAQLFAVIEALQRQELFTWREWSKRFGTRLKHNRGNHTLNEGDDYSTTWLETLEALLFECDPKVQQQLSDLHVAWTEAYLSTPHGSPVAIKIKK